VALYTWDYVAMKMAADHGIRADKTTPWTNLLDLGYVARDEGAFAADTAKAQQTPWTRAEVQPLLRATEAGHAWRARVEAGWEKQVAGLSFWSVSTTEGYLHLGLPGIQPHDALPDLKTRYGSRFGFTRPWKLDQSMGNAKKHPEIWRPWIAGRVWLDLSREGAPIERGAYMRPYGAPLDPVVTFCEAAGVFPEGLSSMDCDISLAHALCELKA